MKHIHERTGYEFEVGEYRDGDKTYDITIISYWKDAETQGAGSPVELVSYYFGGYDKNITDEYIDKWLANREKEIRVLRAGYDFMEAYLITNEDVLEGTTIGRLKRSLAECKELMHDRSWRLEEKYPREWFEAEKIKTVLNKIMENPEPDTTIKITIEREGETTTADLYDHAALVTSLFDSLDYFQSEL